MSERPFSSSYDPSSSTLTIVGAIDVQDEADFADAIVAARSRTDALTIDLSNVDFLPSSALRVLVNATRRDLGEPAESGRCFELVAAPGSIAARVLEIVGFPHRPA